jgi:outer membrane lipopolysaccharide assembly protein LptE/RlpB
MQYRDPTVLTKCGFHAHTESTYHAQIPYKLLYSQDCQGHLWSKENMPQEQCNALMQAGAYSPLTESTVRKLVTDEVTHDTEAEATI